MPQVCGSVVILQSVVGVWRVGGRVTEVAPAGTANALRVRVYENREDPDARTFINDVEKLHDLSRVDSLLAFDPASDGLRSVGSQFGRLSEIEIILF